MIINKVIESKNLKESRNHLETLYSNIENSIQICNDEKLNEKLNSLLRDIQSGETNEGQIMKSVSDKDWFERWGIHYLRYFYRSHQLEICSNFKDNSLQFYGGSSFIDKKNGIEDIFSMLPVPKPSRSKTEFKGNYRNVFYSNYGGCVDGNGITKTNSGDKLVKELKKGDIIINSSGNEDEIICVLKRKIERGYLDMVSINGMKITPWHPVRINDKSNWEFPANICKSPLKINCDFVYNFVLKNEHFLTINGVNVITLGHGLIEGCLKHPFFGTQKVIEQLKKHDGWKEGLIDYQYKPSYENGLVSSLW